MKNNFLKEMFASFLIIFLVFWLVNPFHFWMPTMLQMSLTIMLILLFSFFAHFVWKESVQDEREELHRFIADRTAYLTGSAILIVAFIVQSVHHMIDPWIAVTLAVCILGKIFGSLFARYRH